MRTSIGNTVTSTAGRVAAGTAVLVILALACATTGHAVQFIPSVGFTKATESNSGDGKLSGGVALRAPLLPFLSAEGGISYREESASGDDLKIRMWPVTASLWLTPTPMIYAGGGVGWYRTSYDYRSTLPFEDTTTSKIGIHLGGGLAVPLAPAIGLDLNGRYIAMQQDDSIQFPSEFDPDFWSLSVGLAFKL